LLIFFCGHGGAKGIVLENEDRMAEEVDPKILSDLFELFKGTIECVLFNACFSMPQAEAISPFIGYAIGMEAAIGDKEAIEFSMGFYEALVYKRSIEDAYKFGCNAAKALSNQTNPFKAILIKGNYSHLSTTDFELIENVENISAKRILILAINPTDVPTMKLDEELREIYNVLKQPLNNKEIVIEQRWAVRFGDLHESLLYFKPHIVHFSGTGKEDHGLAFEDDIGKSVFVKTDPLKEIFNLFGDKINCVFIMLVIQMNCLKLYLKK